MARIRTHELIVTVDPCLDSKSITCTSSGVVAKCMSSKTLKPVPSCFSSGKLQLTCQSSIEQGRPASSAKTNQRYQMQLRQAVRSAADAKKVRVPFPAHIEVMLKDLSPSTAAEIKALQRIFRTALKDLERMRRALTRR